MCIRYPFRFFAKKKSGRLRQRGACFTGTLRYFSSSLCLGVRWAFAGPKEWALGPCNGLMKEQLWTLLKPCADSTGTR